jgi:hypothetical protein
MFRRWVYDVTQEKRKQRAATSERAEPIVMPTALAPAPTNGNGAAHSSPANKQKKAQSRAIVAKNGTAKNSLPR